MGVVKFTTPKFVEEINKIYPNEFLVLGEFTGQKVKVRVKHLQCGDEYDIYPFDFLNKRYARCKKCKFKHRAINAIEAYFQENSLDEEYSYDLGNLVYQRDTVTFTHHVCGREHSATISAFKNGARCPYCQLRKLDSEYLQYKIDNIHGKNAFTVLNDDIENSSSQLDILHVDCGRVTNTTVTYFMYQFSHCQHCAKEKRREHRLKPHSLFVKEVEDNFNGAYEVLSEYDGANKAVKILHKNCGNELEFLGGRISVGLFGCKYCNMSTPESIIYHKLLNNNINFVFQYKFDDCLGMRSPLPFDFAVFRDKELVCIIEYDGQGHFIEDSFGGVAYERIVRTDAIKNTYCKENNIKLYRIPYTEFKNLNERIDEILIKENL